MIFTAIASIDYCGSQIIATATDLEKVVELTNEYIKHRNLDEIEFTTWSESGILISRSTIVLDGYKNTISVKQIEENADVVG
ncbi:hypothetical protein POP12_153 [Pectobacterium phage POP12]|nr:hypothetical protein POP12_153 [Pectobacterium phage POP12]